MFADEARFGRMNRPRPCWAPRGVRPSVAAQLIREYIYLYGAVSPKDGRRNVTPASAGAVAFKRAGDPNVGEFSGAVVLKFGDVPEDLSAL